jgi:hypothetical protein
MANTNMIRREITFLPGAFDILKATQRKLMAIHHRSFTNSEVLALVLSASINNDQDTPIYWEQLTLNL